MPEKEFIEKYIRTMTPVLIQGCDFEWLNEMNFSLPSATKVFDKFGSIYKFSTIIKGKYTLSHVFIFNKS